MKSFSESTSKYSAKSPPASGNDELLEVIGNFPKHSASVTGRPHPSYELGYRVQRQFSYSTASAASDILDSITTWLERSSLARNFAYAASFSQPSLPTHTSLGTFFAPCFLSSLSQTENAAMWFFLDSIVATNRT